MSDNKRIAFLDYTRVAACLMVIIYHVCSETAFYYDMDSHLTLFRNEDAHLWGSFYYILGHIGVPIFFMISGWLLLPVAESETTFGFYRRRFRRIIPPFLVFSVFYVFEPVIMGRADIQERLHMLTNIPFTFANSHLWYIYVLVGLYLVIPVISPWLRKATAREELLLIALFVLTSLMPLISLRFKNVWGVAAWNNFHGLWYFSGYLGYMVTAHFIKTHIRWSTVTRLCVGSAGTLLSFAAIYYLYYRGMMTGRPTDHSTFIGWYSIGYSSPLIILLSVSLFLVFTAIPAGNTPPRFITELSRHSFGIYLLHRCVVAEIVLYMAALLPEPYLIKVPVTMALTLFISYFAIKALSYLPGARYIVGSESKLPEYKQDKS